MWSLSGSMSVREQTERGRNAAIWSRQSGANLTKESMSAAEFARRGRVDRSKPEMMKPPSQQLPRRTVGQFGANACGRDLVVGDVHGCFRTLEHTLSTLDFDPDRDRDRLFGVGDLVERGSHSSDALEWIERRFSAVTLGNHDDAALTWLEDKLDGSDEASYGWLRAIAPSAYARWRDAFASLPMAITVETPHGPVGIVHAESPHRSWTRATELLECDREVDVALLGLLVPAERLRRYRGSFAGGGEILR